MSTLRLLVAGLGLALATATAAGDRPMPRPVLPAVAAARPAADALPRFTLFGWVSPPAESTTAARYEELAGAGFNVTVLAWDDPGTPEENLLRLDLSRALGVRNLLLDNRLDDVHEADPGTWPLLDLIIGSYRDQPAFLGWYLGDEPKEDMFPRIGEWFRLLRAHDPGHPGWNNLSGRIAFPSRDAFLDHLRRYVREVDPVVLSTDHYDHFVDGEAGLFIDNAAGTAQVAREAGIPFWGIVLVTRHATFREVDDGLLRWQVAQWLAYGARGIGYFTYWTPPPDPQVGWGDGMIRWEGERTSHYEQVRALNQVVAPVGELLAGLTWLATEHAGGLPVGGTAFAPDALVDAVEGRATLGTFADRDGTPVLFVANRDSSAARTLALELVGERRVERFDAARGWQPWPTAPTPRGRRVELALPAGGFALLRASGGCDGLVSGACSASLASTPEPASGPVRLSARAVRGPSALVLVDAGGRRVRGWSLAGDAPVVTWDGRDDGGRRVRPGLYWARLEDARGSVVRRVTWLGRR